MQRHHFAGLVVGLVLTGAVATPALARAPERTIEVVSDAYTLAECDGFDVVEDNVVTLVVAVFKNRDGTDNREVTHADTDGVTMRVYPDDSTIQVATYRDKGGIFIADADGTFTWTGIIDQFTLRDGTRLVNIGYQQFHVISWDPFEGEWLRDVGAYSLDSDPCTW
jgi:hypothetical protein